MQRLRHWWRDSQPAFGSTRLRRCRTAAFCLSGSGSVCLRGFGPSPFESLPPVVEGAHLNGLAIAEGVDIRETPFDPFRVVFQSHAHIEEHHDFVDGNKELFWLATSFRPRRASL